MRLYPQNTSNQNVPRGSFLIAEESYTSGEIKITYYANKEGYTFKVCDWKGSLPEPVYMTELYRMTGDTPMILKGRVDSHFRNAS